MNNLLRGLIAGIGAKKLGGGCFGSILVFIIIWVALGHCENTFGKQSAIDNKPGNKEIHVHQKSTSTSPFNLYSLKK
jgi:hypothetical protein